MFKEIPKSDIVVRPFKVYKEWSFSHQDQDEVPLYFGLNPTSSFETDDSFGEQSNGVYKSVLYRSVKVQYYSGGATGSILNEIGRRKSYASTNERVLEDEFALLSIPQKYYGEGIKPNTFKIVSGSLELIDDGYSNLIDSGSNIKGNIFYDRGIVVLSKDITSGSSYTEYTFEFRSSKTIYENEIFISVLENEFNVSTNPTSFADGFEYEVGNINNNGINGRNQYTQSYINYKYAKVNPIFWEYDNSSSLDPTGSYLAPYITTIGLYDNEMNMVAVAKLPQPIKSLPDYPLNFIIRFDT